jgi:putative ABC transport system permease protein
MAGWLPVRKPSGQRSVVEIIGVADDFTGRLPSWQSAAHSAGLAERALALDDTEAEKLEAIHLPARVEIAGQRGDIVSVVHGFSSFLGPTFVFASVADARRYLRLPDDESYFILVRIRPGAIPQTVRDGLRARLPEIDVWTKAEFSWRSRLYWLVQTGAGSALTLAAVLGFTIGLLIVAQTIYSLTSEGIEEYATLRAMGASDRYIWLIVLTQSLLCGAVGGAVGLLMVRPFEHAARFMVTWIDVPNWMFGVVGLAIALLCMAASAIAVRPAITVDPGRVFRA